MDFAKKGLLCENAGGGGSGGKKARYIVKYHNFYEGGRHGGIKPKIFFVFPEKGLDFYTVGCYNV